MGLATNDDTGEQRVPGAIARAAAVKSKDRTPKDGSIPPQRNKPLYFISFTLGDRIVTIAHTDIEDTGTPTGPGLFVAVDSFSELATGLPYDPEAPISKALRASMDTDGAQESRDCVTVG